MDSIVLRESKSVYLADPLGLAVGPDGDYFIIDSYQEHLVRFDPNGNFVRVYGQPGGGPGEFGSIAGAVLLWYDKAAVYDYRPRGFEVFNRRTGEPLYFLRHRGRDRISDGEMAGDGNAFLAGVNMSTESGVVAWNLDTTEVTNMVAFEHRCITPGCVAPPCHSAAMARRRALPGARIGALGATPYS